MEIQRPYSVYYSLVDLGEVPDLPTPYGGLTFKAGDPNTILIGGNANGGEGKLYAIRVVRGANQHITSFSGAATVVAAAPYNDGGIAYAPNGVLFLARWPLNELGQLKPGSVTADKVIDLAALGVSGSPGGLNFVPAGHPNENQLKIVGYGDSGFYTLTLTEDGLGTYDVAKATSETTISGGPEGFIYPSPGSPLMPSYDTILVSEYVAGEVAAYRLNANSAPRPETRTTFISGLSGAEGAVIDPLTGDFLFSTFGSANHVVVVRGFNAPPAVALGSPVTNAVITACTWAYVSATASDSDGSVSKLELFEGTNRIGMALSGSCSIWWKTNRVGMFTFTAHATDNGGAVAVSSPVTVSVVAPPLDTLVQSGFNTGGAFCLCSSGTPGKTYHVLGASGVDSNWLDLGPMVATNGILEFYDTGARTNRTRYYRSVHTSP